MQAINDSCKYSLPLRLLAAFVFIFFSIITNAATYNLSTGSYPPCTGGSGWSVSGSTYTCGGNGRVTLAAGDIITANSTATIFSNNGFSLAGNTIGTAGVSINLTSNYGTITSSGTNTVYGAMNGGSGDITLTNTTVNGAVITSGNINLTGGGVTGLVTSSSNTITTNGTNLSGGARAQSGMSITGGTLAGNFVMTSNNAATFSGVTMTSGSISGASTVTIQNGSVLGSGSSSISISSTSGAITVNNSIVYGNLTAPGYSTVNVTNGSSIYGTCSPNSTPANACGSTPPPPINCPAGISSGITGNYYNNRTLTEPSTASRNDAPIDFNWGGTAPGPSGINADNFSTRWTGYVRVTQSGAYRFQTVSDDGVRLYVNGNLVINNWSDHSAATDTSADVVLAAGQTYTIVLEYYENAGDAVMRLLWRLPGASSYVAIPGGPIPALGAGLYECTPVAKPPISSCPTSLSAGITGDYFNNQSLTAPVTSRRSDGPINFDWGTGAPGPTGIGVNNFSVQWNGYIRVTQSGVHRFQTNSDDGVRLTVNGDLLIDEWNDHSVTTHTSAAVNLVAGNSYPIKLEYYENGGFAVAQLFWQTPGSGAYVAIPIGVTASPVSAPGLYECVTTPDSYLIAHNATGITCAAESVTITARNAAGNTYNPPAGTEVTLSTDPATGVWLGGNPYIFSGGEASFTRYLQQTTPGVLTIRAASATAVSTSTITFVDTALRIQHDTSVIPIPNQIAGVNGSAIAKVVSTNPKTGVCEAIVASRTLQTGLGLTCNNPTTCVSGQSFTVNSLPIAANNNAATIIYNNVNLTFNANGEAPMTINYSDVGQITLHGRLKIDALGNNPELILSASSNPFVVKPNSIAITDVQRVNGTANPGGTNASGVAAQFVAAGEQFRVLVAARNGAIPAAITPNFGREIVPETQNLKIKTQSLVYPVGGTATDLTVSSAIASTTPQGTFLYGDVRWNQAGSIIIEPHFDDGNPATAPAVDGDYLGAGLISNLVPSSTVGRFYPDRYALIDIDPISTCPPFHYMGKIFNEEDNDPNTKGLVFKLQALDKQGNLVSNYDSIKGYDIASVNFYTFSGSTDFSSRLVNDSGDELTPDTWVNGQININYPSAQFGREAKPDGPYTDVTIGIGIIDCLDLRELEGKNLTLNTTGGGSCNAKDNNAYELTKFDARYGRLRLDDAFGPETAKLPVNFLTEYWITANATTGEGRFIRNGSDSCTTIDHENVTYSKLDGTMLSPGVFVMPLSGGVTTGIYPFGLPANDFISFSGGDAGHFFTAPTNNAQGQFNVEVDLTKYPWLRFDWNQNGSVPNDINCELLKTDLLRDSDCDLKAHFSFGSYRGHDRVIYWRERF
jgi:MSHA biogenesis protein MshQ